MGKFREYLDNYDIRNKNNNDVEYSNMEEGKKVGIIYHFTTAESIKLFLNPSKEWDIDMFEFISKNGVISTSRNYAAPDNILALHSDFSVKKYNVRIALDGDAISNKFKIRPLAGLKNNDKDVFNQANNDNRVLRNAGENEEAIYTKTNKKFKLLPYVKQIQIYNHSKKEANLFEKIEELVTNKKLNIPVELVRRFKPLKEDNDISSEHYHYDILGEKACL